MEKRRRTVMMAIGRTRRAWEERAKAIAFEVGIPDSYRPVIFYLSRHPGANQKNIADFANITTAAVNQTVKDMVAEGYVRKETAENDRRYTNLFLTEKGEEISNRLKDRIHAANEVITESITQEKEEELIELLDKIYDCLRRDL